MIKDFFKIKKHKFYLKEIEESIPREEVIVPALGGPSWFKNLCPFIGKHKTLHIQKLMVNSIEPLPS